MKNFVMINGSPRKNGNTGYAVKLFEDKLKNKNTELKTLTLADYNIKACEGCRECMKNCQCIITNDDFNLIFKEILNSDVIICFSPVYWYAPTGLMKNFIDRTHAYYPCEKILKNKNAYIVSIGASAGFEIHEKVMTSWLSYYKANIKNMLRLKAREKNDLKKDISETEKLLNFINEIKNNEKF